MALFLFREYDMVEKLVGMAVAIFVLAASCLLIAFGYVTLFGAGVICV